MQNPQKTIEYIPAFEGLYLPYRYKVPYGGRGAAKSWEIARALVGEAHHYKLPILCAREFQNSIADSVHTLLVYQIEQMGLMPFFEITKTEIRSKVTGSAFIFKGLQRSIMEIKSTEGIMRCWVEEAQGVSNEIWDTLIPTIRAPGSQIIISFNPDDESDPTYQRFVENPPPNSWVQKVNYWDNPYFAGTELQSEMEYCKANDYEAYLHIWEGNPKTIGDAVIFRNKYRVESFETPADARFYHGVDWGFSQDPTVMTRCFEQVIEGRKQLFIDEESFGYGVDISDTPALFDKIPTARQWPIKADCARPETISAMSQAGFNISGAKKWSGSVEDGISHLRGYDQIIIHPRCKHIADEARLYQYKVDRQTGDILPIIVDKHNHGWDAVRYSLDGVIRNRGDMQKIKLGGL